MRRRWVWRGLAAWALWRLVGPEVPPRFEGTQERPLDLEGWTVVVGRREFMVRETGPPDAPPMLLLHGWAYAALATWHKVVPHLAADHRLVMIDLRNHGRSERIRGRFEIEDVSDEVAAIIDRLGLGGATVVGYSMGGMVAQALVARHPGLVSRMVLAATAARPVDRPRWLTVPLFAAGRALARIDRLTVPRFVHRYLLKVGALEPRHAAWMWEELLDRDVDLYYEAGFAILRFDGSGFSRSIDVPTLCLIPTRDQLVEPRLQYQTADAIGAEIVEIVDARHEAVLTHSGEIAKAIREFAGR